MTSQETINKRLQSASKTLDEIGHYLDLTGNAAAILSGQQASEIYDLAREVDVLTGKVKTLAGKED